MRDPVDEPGRPSANRATPAPALTDRATAVLQDVDARHGQDMLGLALRSGVPPDAAEDAVQEALLRLWLEIRAGVEILDPKGWAFRTLYRLVMDEHRFRRRIGDLRVRLQSVSPRQPGLDIADRLSLWAMVDRLPTRQRQVLYLRYAADMSFDQLARVMGITASAARTHATLAGIRLRETFGAAWTDR